MRPTGYKDSIGSLIKLAGILRVWFPQGYVGVGHCKDALLSDTVGILCGSWVGEHRLL